MTQFPDLASWMAAEGLKDRHVAGRIERSAGRRCSEFAVKKWRLKQRVPRRPFMNAIIRISGGNVTADSFYRSAADPHLPTSVDQIVGHIAEDGHA